MNRLAERKKRQQKKPPTIQATQILGLLAAKHTRDVFVPECKDGPTWMGTHLRIDAWAMQRSWTEPATFGYEIKVSRQDWLRDDKWQAYLPLCSDFYIVAPVGVVEAAEIPADVGLLRPSTNCKRLLTMKKAARRQVTIPEELWRYILMCRARIETRHNAMNYSGAEQWRQWLAGKQELRALGRGVSRALQRRIDEEITNRTIEQGRLDGQLTQYAKVREIITAAGLDPDTYGINWSFDQKMADWRGTVPPALSRVLQNVVRECENLRAALFPEAEKRP